MDSECDPLTDAIIGCAFAVANALGSGFLEKVYENALSYELRSRGHHVDQQFPVQVCYRDVVVGDYVVDLLVEQRVLIELKAVKAIDVVHEAQLLNYLRGTGLRVGLILNFGTPRLGIKRRVL